MFLLAEKVRRKVQRWKAEHLARRPHQMRNARPLISFTFDDFPISALEIGGPVLQRHGMAGTYYVSLGLTGTTAPTGPIIERSRLTQALEQGHELGCHTFAHCHATDTPTAVFERNILENGRVLRDLLPHVQFKTLSYPIGCPRPATKRCCARYFAGARAGGQTFNQGEVDLNNLRALFLEQSRDDLPAVLRTIDASCRANGWLILATHDICPNPTRYGVVPEYFAAVVDHAAAAGAEVVTVSRGLELIGVDRESPWDEKRRKAEANG